ncbi:MAG: glycosyltransferase [Bacteroidales bacterium]|nr:glycosyltransferase [Bacteroidales bacterium]
MKILHIPSWFPQVDNPLDGNFILKHIATTAADTTAIVLHHTKGHVDIPIISHDGNIIFHPIEVSHSMSKWQLYKAYVRAFDEIVARYGRPDVIHLHVALPLGFLAARLSRKYRIPLVVSEHWSVYYQENRFLLTSLQKLALHYIFHTVRHITTVSEYLHTAIVEMLPEAKNIPYTIVSNTVNTNLFCTKPCQPHGKKQILHISNLEQESKNIMGILHVIKRLSQQRSDFELNIIHDLANLQVEQFIRLENLGNCVHLLGKKTEEEVAEAIQNCDFMLQFSNYETQSCVLLEAFCCGKPAVATPVGGIPEIATADNTVFTEPCNEDDCLEKIAFMLDHFQNFNAEEIQKQAAAKCDSAIIGKKFLNIYQQMVQ